MADTVDVFLAKAQESLAGAESELANGRYNNCANRCYYACFQGAIYALRQAGIRPRGVNAQWSHAFVQAEFVGQLVNRRKIYPSVRPDVLAQTLELRRLADYKAESVRHKQASRLLTSTRAFLAMIGIGGGEQE
jgi:uncharacterized protein (UPF0332 family)